ncbi:MAG: hypothetical protein JOY71_29640 [Acetobacteraceae bacterium]|nr:hypothetical protein [Acetobacteraceae bacterium]
MTARRAQKDNPNIALPTEAELDKAAEACVKNVQTMERPTIHYRLKIDLKEFQRGVFKIAYELAFMWLGEPCLDDPMAAKLRTVILEGADPAVVGVYGRIELGTDIEPLRPWANEKDTHIAFNAITNGRMAVCIKIFDAISAAVVVSDQPYKCSRSQFDANVMRFVGVDAASGIERQSSYIDECGRLASEMTDLADRMAALSPPATET